MSSSAEPRFSSRSRAFVSIPDMNRYYVHSDQQSRDMRRGLYRHSSTEPVFKEWGWLLRQTCQGFELRWFGSGARKLQIQQAFAAHPPNRTIRPSILHAVAQDQLSRGAVRNCCSCGWEAGTEFATGWSRRRDLVRTFSTASISSAQRNFHRVESSPRRACRVRSFYTKFGRLPDFHGIRLVAAPMITTAPAMTRRADWRRKRYTPRRRVHQACPLVRPILRRFSR
jgi:hypothetical protein